MLRLLSIVEISYPEGIGQILFPVNKDRIADSGIGRFILKNAKYIAIGDYESIIGTNMLRYA